MNFALGKIGAVSAVQLPVAAPMSKMTAGVKPRALRSARTLAC